MLSFQTQKSLKKKLSYNVGKLPLFFSILNQTQALQFLMGASSENTNSKGLKVVYFSKNNVDIFNGHFVRARCFMFYSTFRYINSAIFNILPNKSTVKTPKIMFASHTPVYANLMSGAGLLTNSASSSNRWLNGNLSAQIKLKLVPNYLFMPDPEENNMITREALRKKIPIITITNSDSVFNGGIVLIGNNRTFKYTSQLTEMVVRFLQVSYLRPQIIPQYQECLSEMSGFRARKFSSKLENLGF